MTRARLASAKYGPVPSLVYIDTGSAALVLTVKRGLKAPARRAHVIAWGRAPRGPAADFRAPSLACAMRTA
jgi:hypothetical protein